MTGHASSRPLSVLDETESRDDVAPQDAAQDGRVENFVGEDPGGGSGERAVLETINDGDVGPGRADLELEGELQHILLVGERNAEDVILLRLDGRPALSSDGVGDEVA